MKKILYTATVISHIKLFHQPFMKMMKEKGYQVDVASDLSGTFDETEVKYCDNLMNVVFPRNPFSTKTFKAYKQIKRIVKENDYDIIHCNSPTASILTRIAARKCKNTKVIYMAHGFHFFKGAPLMNWLLFYPAEYLCSYFTDILVTINDEDYRNALKMHAKKVYKINGVGLDIKKYQCNRDYQVFNNKLLTIGELIPRKNHKTVIAALESTKYNYTICGSGPLKEEITRLGDELHVDLRMEGFCSNVPEKLAESDIYIFPSFQEGLPKALMEAMASGLPCVVSNVRGNNDLIENGKGGFLVENKPECYLEAINKLASDSNLRKEMGSYNRNKIENYSIEKILPEMEKIYGV